MWLIYSLHILTQVCKAFCLVSHWKQLRNKISSSKASPHQAHCDTGLWSSESVFCGGMKQAAQSGSEVSETIFSSNTTLPQRTMQGLKVRLLYDLTVLPDWHARSLDGSNTIKQPRDKLDRDCEWCLLLYN